MADESVDVMRRRSTPAHRLSQLLLVNDDPALLDALSGMLQIRLGHSTVDTCRTGMKALDCMTAKRYDVIISDIHMSEIDGLQLLRSMKKARPDTLVVLISGQTDHALIAEAFQTGAADFITKPIDRDMFLRSVRQALNISRLRLLLEQQEALISRTREQYMGIVWKMGQLKEQWVVSSETLSSDDSGSVTSSRAYNKTEQQQSRTQQLRAHNSRANRHLARLDAFLNKVVQAYRETSGLLHAAEDVLHQYASLRLHRTQ
jgi:YesN/AraC family two-component response regulator